MPADMLTKPAGPDAKNPARRVIDLQVPPTLFLERQVTAPVTARSKLETLAELDLRHRTPFSPGDVYSQLGTPKVQGDTLVVPQWVAKRSDVAEWQRNLSAHGMRLRRVHVDGQPRPIADFSATIAPGGRKLRWVNGLLAAVAVAAVLAGWLYPGWVARDQSRVLQDDLVALRAEALALRQEVETLRSRDSERAAFLDTLLRRAALIDTLRDLTVALPDEVWIETVTYSPKRTTINGQIDGSAADLVLALGKRPVFRNPRLSGPVSKTPADGERFEITVDLEGS
ncbi:PilN domain-containing protein [Thalassococcus sp. BH17M4-6]|uniref:PilN domain-containing protein n=1 Tax=Thalassococcus sp. BH17M4-6 TaxID=3413148 RepID=UPI003BBF9230